MSGECEICGNQTLECSCPKAIENQIYYKGKWFQDLEEVALYQKEWNNFPIEEKTAEELFDRLKKDILTNVFIYSKNLKNQDFEDYLGKIFHFSIKLLFNNIKNI